MGNGRCGVFGRDDLLSGHEEWAFLMVGRQQLADVMLKAADGDRPMATLRVLAEIMRRFEWAGTATFARHDIADALKINVATVSFALNNLERYGVVTNRRSDGRRITVSINPKLATMLRAGERRKAQADAPPIRPAA